MTLINNSDTAVNDDLPVNSSAVKRREIVFIESNVTDYQTLVDGLNPDAEVYVLDANQDNLAQMAQILSGRSGIDALHIISHGSDGTLQLGAVILTTDTLQDHADDLATIGNALTENGDILLYGCNVAVGLDGKTFVNRLAELTGADVAASDDLTGNTQLGGDWVLETQTGDISTVVSPNIHWDHVLAGTTLAAGDIAVLGLNADDTLATTQRWAFVPLVDLASGTEIHFTDNNFDVTKASSGNQFGNTIEGRMTWTVPSTITAGTLFVVTNNSSTGIATIANSSGTNYSGVVGSVGTSGSGANFTANGDNIFAYQATDPTTTTLGATFIYGLNTGHGDSGAYPTVGTWNLLNTTAGAYKSGLPTGLVNGTTAIALTSSSTVGSGNYGYDNMWYSGTKNGSKAELLAAIGTASNWSGSDTAPYNFASIGNFTVTSPPTLTSATYNASTGVLAVTGTNLTSGGAIDETKLTLTGEGGATYTLTETGSITASSTTAFSITLNATDKAALNPLMNKASSSSTGGTTYNLAGVAD